MFVLLMKPMTRRFWGAQRNRIMVRRNFVKSGKTQYPRGFQANGNRKLFIIRNCA